MTSVYGSCDGDGPQVILGDPSEGRFADGPRLRGYVVSDECLIRLVRGESLQIVNGPPADAQMRGIKYAPAVGQAATIYILFEHPSFLPMGNDMDMFEVIVAEWESDEAIMDDGVEWVAGPPGGEL